MIYYAHFSYFPPKCRVLLRHSWRGESVAKNYDTVVVGPQVRYFPLSSIHLPSKVIFHQRSVLGFSPECGIAQLRLSLFVSSSWSSSMTSNIFLFDLVQLNFTRDLLEPSGVV